MRPPRVSSVIFEIVSVEAFSEVFSEPKFGPIASLIEYMKIDQAIPCQIGMGQDLSTIRVIFIDAGQKIRNQLGISEPIYKIFKKVSCSIMDKLNDSVGFLMNNKALA